MTSVARLLEKLLLALLRGVESLNRRFSRCGDRPFFDGANFGWTHRLAGQWPEIRRELDQVLADRDRLPAFQDISPDQAVLTTDQGWKTFFFLGYGVVSEANCRRCPVTAHALRQIPGLTTACFSLLAPGKSLPPHRGPYNGVLRFHLGLRVPHPGEGCAIRVGGETRAWREGEGLVFDDTYDHEAWNRSPAWRVVLFVDFKRPLPWLLDGLNSGMIWLIGHTPLIQVAARNQRAWEKSFYGPGDPQP
jgi:beta-hydroxylase